MLSEPEQVTRLDLRARGGDSPVETGLQRNKIRLTANGELIMKRKVLTGRIRLVESGR